MSSKIEYLFVYGTLLGSMDNIFATLLAANSEFIDEGFFYGRLYDLNGYPGAIKDKKCVGKVKGQVFCLKQPDFILPQIDAYEEVGSEFEEPNEYTREIVDVYLQNGKCISSWVYLYNWSTIGLIKIESGDYKSYVGR